ncbi:MAG TPA: NAD(P)/FAD-dependent oxidoreductase [Rhizomicrobium sp.]|nr:NAD(P)/FAD-dependent oxidoreductase [Rhizomicrobium sp.]
MRIGIIGCGVAGQAAAIALARDGHDVTLVERFAVARPVGAGLLLQPSGLLVLERLGARDAAEAWGARIQALDGRTPRGRRVLDLNYGAQHGLGIHRAALFDVLHARVKTSGAELRLDFEVAAVEQDAAATLVSKTGARAGPFELVLDCAGAHDAARDGLGLECKAPLYPWGALWCAVPDRAGTWTERLRQTYDGAHTMMGVLPIGRAPDAPGPHVAWFWSLKLAEVEAVKAAGLAALKRRALAVWPQIGRILDEITAFDQLALATYRDVVMKPWHRGCVLVLGDAAHGTSPQLGQGANLALIDALTIAHCVKAAPGVAAALALYEKMRRPHIAYYQLASRALTPAFQSDSRVMAWLRDTFLVAARHIPIGGYVTRTTLSGVRKLPFGLWRLPG